jgi:diadenosine tetraphosphatase ApaH/serine/threonine PP2A family protein phosphatase
MRTLVVSDIHGNLEALKAVLADAGSFEAAICLGDIVGYGAQPNECIEAIQRLPRLVCLAGNHDLGATGRIDAALFSAGAGRALAWTKHALRPDNSEYLKGLRPTGIMPRIALSHASPRDPVWEYLETVQQATANFKLFEQEACFVGHTHVPRVFEVGADGPRRSSVSERVELESIELFDGARRIVNPGSVGQPRDGDPRAAYAVLDTETGSFTARRVPYDVSRAQELILAAGLPTSLASRLALGM